MIYVKLNKKNDMWHISKCPEMSSIKRKWMELVQASELNQLKLN